MKRLSECSADHLRMTRGDFLAKYPVPVLLHRWDKSADEGDAAATAHVSLLDGPAKPFEIARSMDPVHGLGFTSKGAASLDIVVFPIVKRTGAMLHDRVSVGRSRNADIHLPFRRISKFHAYFTTAVGGSKYMITDSGSTNGTSVQGRKLPAGSPAEVPERGVIHLSHFLFLFLSAAGFYSFLSQD